MLLRNRKRTHISYDGSKNGSGGLTVGIVVRALHIGAIKKVSRILGAI